jgi:maltose O-acetyltransferase
LREILVRARSAWARLTGVNVGRSCRLSLSSRLEPGRRGSIRIGEQTQIAFNTHIFSRDAFTGEDRPVAIGRWCFIGGGGMILPGVTIGDECIVGSGAVVFEDVPARSIVVGNPARVIRRNISVGPFGKLKARSEDQPGALDPPE